MYSDLEKITFSKVNICINDKKLLEDIKKVLEYGK